MAITHRIEGDYAEIIIDGNFLSEELFDGFEALFSAVAKQPRTGEGSENPGVHLLINVTASEELPPMGAVERVAGIIAHSNSGFSGRVAVLVGEKLRYGRARQLGAFLSGYGISSEPFYIREDAIRWLNTNV
jgi:hypothetical protein